MPSKTAKPKQYEIFFSYSTRDRWIARQCVSLIERVGEGRIHVFLDEKDIEGGDHIADAIRESIRRCDELVVLLTPSSKQRPWVIIEMSAAWVLKKRVVQILSYVDPHEMPPISFPFKAIDLNSFEQYLEQVSKRTRGKGERS